MERNNEEAKGGRGQKEARRRQRMTILRTTLMALAMMIYISTSWKFTFKNLVPHTRQHPHHLPYPQKFHLVPWFTHQCSVLPTPIKVEKHTICISSNTHPLHTSHGTIFHRTTRGLCNTSKNASNVRRRWCTDYELKLQALHSQMKEWNLRRKELLVIQTQLTKFPPGIYKEHLQHFSKSYSVNQKPSEGKKKKNYVMNVKSNKSNILDKVRLKKENHHIKATILILLKKGRENLNALEYAKNSKFLSK